MQKYFNRSWLPALFSGLLTYYAICHINFILSWVCYIPLFISIHNKSPNRVFKAGIIFGLAFSSFAFSWMIPGAERFTGYNILYGVAVFLVSSAFYTLFCALLLYCFALVKKPDHYLGSFVHNSIVAASLFCIAEAFLRIVSTGLPWFDFHSGNGLAENLYAVQPASLFGIHIMTFVVVSLNYLVALIAVKRLWIKLYIPVAVAIVYLFTGSLILQNFNNRPRISTPFNVAVLAGNIAPDLEWDDNTGNVLVQKLLDLNRVAVGLKPGMALWSESAIPWTYKKDDDLVKEIFKITDPAGITHIMGINTAYGEHEVFNSAYCIMPGGKVTGRYDKQYLLSLIEKPLNGWIMPFFSTNGYVALTNPGHSHPLPTPYGKAGVLICNEAALPAAAASQVNQGAEFLINMSNDGWFNDTYIVRAHYYYARLRAVESRKDIAINCNNGFSGLIKASGDIEVQEKSNQPFVKMVTIQPNKYVSTASLYPGIFLYGCTACLVIFVVLFFIKKPAQKIQR